ncbi:unnamed protein product [marine sediment metagenome]|uniref:Uncharacterized protein n=1 Tax=marine sediment metagenome TaxID=412755 RepID=X1H6U1_9ZZZZ
MASPIAKSWVYTTVLIENEWGERGTGFIVSRTVERLKGARVERIFLVTNKHVLNKDPTKREEARKILLHMNVKNPDGSILGKSVEVPLLLKDKSKIWREHPDPEVDVLGFDITGLYKLFGIPQIEKKWISYGIIADKSKLRDFDVTIGEEILVIGYPLGLRQESLDLPLVRQGIIASHIGQTFSDYVRESDGSVRKRTLRGFLIDGAVIHGSSGSPVILKPTIGRFVRDGIEMGRVPMLLLGIVAETKYAPIPMSEGVIPSFAGLGLAFDAETVKETIELFFE